jgi:hypothetical protein
MEIFGFHRGHWLRACLFDEQTPQLARPSTNARIARDLVRLVRGRSDGRPVAVTPHRSSAPAAARPVIVV